MYKGDENKAGNVSIVMVEDESDGDGDGDGDGTSDTRRQDDVQW